MTTALTEFDLDAFVTEMQTAAAAPAWTAPPGRWNQYGEYTNAPDDEEPPAPSLIDAALTRRDARPARRIDYDRMRELFPKQKAALTRAVKTKDPEKVAATCKKTVAEWNEIGAWPDNWSAWQRALDDVLPWHQQISLEEL